MKLTAQATIQIQKPIEDVFESIVDPSKMTQYFISESTGRLDEQKEVFWEFPEFDGHYPVNEIKTERNRSVSFVWDPDTKVRIELDSFPDGSTLVKVTEKGKEINDENISWVIQNTEGWANFLACLKAYLEYGIPLRKGAFDFMKKNSH